MNYVISSSKNREQEEKVEIYLEKRGMDMSHWHDRM